jgi:XTP/dITP diphosphohydrolase
MQKLIVATNNMGKLREIKEICSGLPFNITSLKDHWNPVPSIPENGTTFIENARAKAQWVFDKKGIWSLADDSGLEVDFLGGAPSVRSARFAGEHATDLQNLEKLLAALHGCNIDKRTARFRCVLVMKLSASEELVTEGVCEGTLGLTPRGTDGFGYDPVFMPAGHSKTFAELDPLTKNAISHRGKALAALRRKLDERFGKNVACA